jgi:hypothetical protein
VHRDATDVVSAQLNFSSVDTDPHREVEAAHRFPDGKATADGSSRPIECCQRAVAGQLDQAAVKAFDLSAQEHLVAVEDATPPVVA